ncbi:MAG: pantoate--beta-alanine ligase [Actinobacteria bacterium]|nr:pantoate--beta-alanine ligase [Actinomycetota bacterium]
MQIVEKSAQLPSASALVPTLGALHEGHASLIRQAREISENVVVSIFVNPLQFNDTSDLLKYPRTPESDENLARESGASTLWLPEEDEIYPSEIEKLSAGVVGEKFEGLGRPGHFSGVLTVVKRLFDLAKPEWAIFGEKDFQQLFLIEKMVKEENLKVKIIRAKTIRSEAGLALSSRNIHLDHKDKRAALVIWRALSAAYTSADVHQATEAMKQALATEPAFTCEYAVIIDEETFGIATNESKSKRAIIAGWINGVRLIDNRPMSQAHV